MFSINNDKAVGKDLTKVNKIIFMCSGFTCNKKGGEENIVALRASIKENALEAEVHTIKTLCTGQCESGPTMLVHPDGVWYREMTVSRAERIVTSHVMQGQLLENILFNEGDDGMDPAEVTSSKPACN
ncbi:(2Fe-2S) ferredoxin domain-containing protein [Pontibacter sp. 13R65]|uniref:(2Fe-2S) ferredoxin domain-containing protein n=1 Tax=Pontibacter sp. 13R65 TaxID=3127458 RepID=UPI00301CE6DA